MANYFRSWDVEQGWLLPASAHDFVPAYHVAHFVRACRKVFLVNVSLNHRIESRAVETDTMILNSLAEKLKRRARNDFKGRHFKTTLIIQAVT